MLTNAQIAQAKAAVNPTTNPTQPLTPEQAKASFGASTQPQNLGQRVAGDISEAGNKINQQITGQGESAGKGAIERGTGAAATAATGVGKVASEVLPKPVRDVGSAVGGAVGQGFNFLQDKLASTKLFSDIGKLEAQGHINPQNNPEFYQLKSALSTASNVGQVAGEVAGAEQVTGGLGTAAKVAKGAVKQVTKSAATVAPEQAAKTAAETAKANMMQAHDMIDKEVRNVGEKYGDVGKALNHAEVTKGSEPVKVLSSYAEGKALPSMSKGGKMNSLPAINYLRTQMKGLGKIKGDLVDTAKQGISVDDFQKTIEDKIKSSNGSQAAKDTQIADISKEMDRLRKSYPDGIPTKEMDKLKTEHANESSSYKTTGFPSRFAPDTHSMVADTARTLVEKQGGEAPIEELNKWITSHHDAIKVLEKMHGKTPHGGMFSRHVGGIAGEIAGMAGGMAIGHPFLGAMAGRGASEAINNILSSHFISNPLKRSIITSMKGENPGVIQKALDFIDSEGKAPGQPTEATSPKVEESTSPNDSKPPGKVQGAIPETSQVDESKITNPIDPKLSPEEKVTQLTALTEENQPIVKDFMRQVDDALGTQSKDNMKKPERILSKSERPEIKTEKPWFGVEHIRDAYRFKTKLNDISQIGDIGKMLKENNIQVVKQDTAKMFAPKTWGWRFAAFDLRMPNGQLVEYYASPKEFINANEDKAHVIFEKWRNESKENILANKKEYAKDVFTSRKIYSDAWDKYLKRTGQTPSEARASWDKVEASLGGTSE